MKVRTLLVVLVLVALAACALAARGPEGKQGPVGMRGMHGMPPVNIFCKALALDEATCGKVRGIVEKFRQDVKVVAQDQSLNREQKKDKMQSLRAKAESDIMVLLTPDQQDKAKKRDMVQRLLSPRPGRGIEWALNQLDLTDQQKQQIEAIFKEGREAAKAVKADTSLTDAQKQQKLAEIRKQTHDKVMSVLTEEQKKKLQEIMGRHAGRKPKL